VILSPTLRCLVFSICIPAMCARAGTLQPVQLRESAVVRGDRITLSDLLPADAPLTLRQQGSEVTLGASPNLGSTRVFTAEGVVRGLATKPELLRYLKVPDRILVRRQGVPLDRDSLGAVARRFLEETGFNIPDDAPLTWDREIVTRTTSPALAVSRAKSGLTRNSTELWMRCVDRGTCPDFLARVQNTTCSPGRRLQHPSNSADRPGTASSDERIKEGSKAWLIIDSGSIRLSLAVVCLQPGSIGEKIRVLSPSNHRVFLAEIVGAGILHMRIES
jgi:hypothetical protein